MFNVLFKLSEFSSSFSSSLWVLMLDSAVQVGFLLLLLSAYEDTDGKVLVVPCVSVICFWLRGMLCVVCLAGGRKHLIFKPPERECSANQTSFYLVALLSLMAYWFTLLSQVGPGPAFCPVMCLSVLQFHILSRTQTCSSVLGSSSVTAGSFCAFLLGSWWANMM